MALAQRFNINTQATNGTDAGTHLSMNDIIPIQPITKGTAADDEKLTLQQIQSIPYGFAALSGNTYTVTLINYPMDFSLRVGSKMLVKFNNAKSGTTGLNLSINGVLVPMYNQGVQISTIDANQIIEFTFIGTIANGVHTITGANASAGVSVSQLNGALANYEKINNVTLGASTDLNDIITEGHYTCYPLNQMANTPTTNSYGILIVHKSSVYILQEITTAERKYTRVKTQTGFTNWIEVATEFTLASLSIPIKYRQNQSERDFNTCIPPVGKREIYFIPVANQSNAPIPNYNWILEVDNKNVIPNVSSEYRISQLATAYSGANPDIKYTRNGSSNDGITWTWGNWQKLTTETDVNNALTNYRGKLEKTVTIAKGNGTHTTVTLDTSGTYLLHASGNNYGGYLGFVTNGYNSRTNINELYHSSISAVVSGFKTLDFTSFADGDIILSIIRL